MGLPRDRTPGVGWSPPTAWRPREPTRGRHCATTSAPRASSYITAIVAAPGDHRRRDLERRDDGGHAQLALLCRRTLARYLDSDDVFEVTRAGPTFSTNAAGVTFPVNSTPGLRPSTTWQWKILRITFNESYISRSTPTFTERRANTTLHEMCHMWFVTWLPPPAKGRPVLKSHSRRIRAQRHQ